MKILTIVGARPQFVKASMLSRVFKEKGVNEVIVHTGQHFDANMSDIFFEEMEIPRPHYNLNINSMGHGAMTGNMMIKLEEVMLAEKPDLVLVYGDTNSTMAGALTARKLNIKLAHVEAGLRNFDFTIPEDVNRVLTDRISDYLFCSTDTAIKNLEAEGFRNFPCKIVRTGDLLADTVDVFSKKVTDGYVNKTGLSELPTQFILATVHRQDSTTDEKLPGVVAALNKIAQEYPLVFPIHPRTRKSVERLNLVWDKNIHLIEPTGYLDMLYLLKHCKYVITDSGGVQREAYLCARPSLLLMEYTPWEELVDFGFSVTTSIGYDAILENYGKMLALTPDFSRNLYGDGKSRFQIVDYLCDNLN